MRTLLLFVVLVSMASWARGQNLKEYDSRYYTLHTDLPGPEAREAVMRIDRMDEQYQSLVPGGGKLQSKLPFYLYANAADYTQAGGAKNSAGYFNGEKLMAMTLRREDGSIALTTWQVVQHEGFHQFASAIVGEDLPMWLDEGLAEYFGQSLFTGDGFVSGLVPQSRLMRLQQMLVRNENRPLGEFFAMTREQWNANIDLKNYDQAWSIVHFFKGGANGKYTEAFGRYLKTPDKPITDFLPDLQAVEKDWKAYWLGLGEKPTADLYAQGTARILANFLARAQSQGQRFESIDAFLKTPAAELKHDSADWLPSTLFTMAVNEVKKMKAEGDVLVLETGDAPALLLSRRNGFRLRAGFVITEQHRVGEITVTILKGATTQAGRGAVATRPAGEMLK